MGSAVATPLENSSDSKLKRATFGSTAAPLLESWIDAMDEELPALTNFILPSGTGPSGTKFPSASKPLQQHLCLAYFASGWCYSTPVLSVLSPA